MHRKWPAALCPVEQVAEAVDRVERGVDLARQAKVRHVADDSRRGKPVAGQAGIAVRHRLGVQVVARDFVTGLGELHQQPPGAAGRLEQPPHASRRELLEAAR